MTSTLTATAVAKALRSVAQPERVPILQSFFKTGPGKYAEGDRFIGVYIPRLRKVTEQYRDLPQTELAKLLKSVWHEERAAAAFILVLQFEKGEPSRRKEIFDFYLECAADCINNWDLVDGTAGEIVGGHLHTRGKGWAVLRKLARSANLWERRISIIATLCFIRRGEFEATLEIAEMLLGDRHDLIHKAVGWMLREVGKRDVAAEESFLDRHAARMPRTMLRYAIERFPEKRRKYYLAARGV